MPTETLSRADHLRQTILDAEAELQSLTSVEGEAQRRAVNRNTVQRFRSGVEAQRLDLQRLNSNIFESLDSLRAACPEVHHMAHGMLVLRDGGQGQIDALTNIVKQNVLAFHRAECQLADAETRLRDMEESLA